MEKVLEFCDAFGNMGIFIMRRDDHTLLYFNEKIKKLMPNLRVGDRCSDVFSTDCMACPIRSFYQKDDNQLTIAYHEEFNGYVEMMADEYMWEGEIPAYIISVIPQMQGEYMKDSIRYNRMMDKAATALSEFLAYCNYTKRTLTCYRATSPKSLRRGVETDLDAGYAALYEVIHPEDREAFLEKFSVDRILEQLHAGAKELYGEYREYKDNHYRWISMRILPIENPFDDDELCVFVIRDINKRKQMERQLALQLNATYQSIPGGVAIMQMNEQMTVMNASQSFYDMMHKTYEDYENGYLEHILDEDRHMVRRKLKQVTKAGNSFDIVYRERDYKQKLHWVQARGTKISEEDGYPVYLIIRMDVTELKDAQQQLIEEQRQYREYTEGLIDTLSNLVEFRDLDSGEHIKRTRTLTRILLRKLREKDCSIELSDERIEKVAEAASLHDVGKIAISDTILNKPGRLTPEEFEKMKQHTVKGYEILKTLNLVQDEEQLQYILDISRYHHERWDGNGYPDHLKGDEIPIWSQVVSIVDVYDALVSPRVYKKAYSHKKALQMILDGECGCFNPLLLECIKECAGQMEKEYIDTNIKIL